MRTKGPVKKDTFLGSPDKRKRWGKSTDNRGPHIGWSKTRDFMYKLRAQMMPKRGSHG